MEVIDLNIGTRFELEILGTNGNRIGTTHISKLLEHVNERTLIVSAPIYESRLIYVPLNGKVRITFFHNKHGLHGFTAIVTAREQRESLSVLRIQAESPPEKTQRRTHYRLDCTLNVEYKVYNDNLIHETDKPQYKKALTKNISGSGACIVVSEEIPKDTAMEIYIDLGETVKVRAKCSVSRCSLMEMNKIPKYMLGLHFTEITTLNQDNIIKYIFEQQRRLLKNDVLEK